MPASTFVKENRVLLVGLALPVLLMAGFLAVSRVPETLGDPPKYDLVFTIQDYPPGPIPVNVRLVVKDGTLVAQYTRPPATQNYGGNQWKKLFIYESSTRTLRELAFGYPKDMDAIQGTREDVVESTANLRLDTTLQSPDGYAISYGDGSRGGLLGEIFGARSYNEPRLRKGAASVPLNTAGTPVAFGYGSIEFVGWVTSRR